MKNSKRLLEQNPQNHPNIPVFDSPALAFSLPLHEKHRPHTHTDLRLCPREPSLSSLLLQHVWLLPGSQVHTTRRTADSHHHLANRDRREALRGAEEGIFDLLSEVLTSTQWVELLQAPLERAAGEGNTGLANKLVDAGASISKALHTRPFEAVMKMS